MSKPYKILLFLSLLLTAAIFVHEWIYDKPSVPYTLQQTLTEIAIMGTLLTAVFFAILSGLFYLYTAAGRLLTRGNTKSHP